MDIQHTLRVMKNLIPPRFGEDPLLQLRALKGYSLPCEFVKKILKPLKNIKGQSLASFRRKMAIKGTGDDFFWFTILEKNLNLNSKRLKTFLIKFFMGVAQGPT